MVMCSCICKRESALITNFSTKHDAHNAVQLVDWLTRFYLEEEERMDPINSIYQFHINVCMLMQITELGWPQVCMKGYNDLFR